MKELTQEESRGLMVEILKDVTSYCDTHSLQYFLSSGTLIGAIRHKGFIPWDDDIDIDMPRPDYDKFVALYRQDGRFAICAPGDKNCYTFFTKVYDTRTSKREDGVDYSLFEPFGVYIDIFPVDGQPLSIEEFARQSKHRNFLYRSVLSAVRPMSGLSLIGRIKSALYRLIGKDFFIKSYVKSASRYDYATSAFVGMISPFSGLKNRHSKIAYSSRIMVDFEGEKFWTMVGYDEYLTNIYGDYMTPPPVEQRDSTHTGHFYWKDDSPSASR